MTTRQSFGDFLNSAGPSTPRGRGGSFRGGRGGRGRGGGGGKADYSNVPLDYERLNKQGYTRMEGFVVAPYGPSTSGMPGGSNSPYHSNTPNRGRGSWTPRGRGSFTPHGGNRNRLADESPSQTPSGASGSATPVRGLGFRGRGADVSGRGGRGGPAGRGGLGLGSSGGGYTGRGKENQNVFWGGRGAPLFVKAGELFKEGEVDVVTVDEDQHIHIESMPLSDPSAPQMLDLTDDVEIEVYDAPDSMGHQHPDMIYHHGPEQELATEIETNAANDTATTVATREHVATVRDNTSAFTQPDHMEETEDQAPLFFIDTAPVDVAGAHLTPSYNSIRTAPLGSNSHRKNSSQSEDEKIVFVPRTYRQPEPLSVPASSTIPARVPPAATVVLETHFQGVYMDPRATVPRKDKKAAKREKRKANKKKGKKGGKGVPRDDSDMEWGSDGPPPAIFAVDGLVRRDADDDVEVLRDYLAGTLLNAKIEMEEMEEERRANCQSISGPGDEDVDLGVMRRFGEGMRGLTGVEIVSQDGEEGEMEAETESKKEEEVEVDDEDDGQWESSSGSQLTDDEYDKELSGRGDASKSKSALGKTANGKSKGKGRARLDPEEFYDPEGYLRKSGPAGSGVSLSGDSEASDSDDSSVIGDMDAAILEEMMDEDMDSSEEDDFFNGQPTWADETEWFIRDMEDALDGSLPLKDRKQRNKLFRAIETGDFGDDWPTEPVKKGKKNKHVPAELQDVWERDRQKKAEKKRQRELERLIAQIEPPISGRKSKKGKGKNKIHQASIAHLIPGSAAEVAEMFDISSEEEFLNAMAGQRNGGKKRRGINLLPKTIVQVDEEIREFLEDVGRTTMALPPMDKEGRKRVHMLAESYGLKSKSRGSGKSRFPVLIKSSRSGMVIDEARIGRIIAASASTGGAFYKSLYSKSGGGKKKGPKGDVGSSVRHKDGDAVGEGAERIGMDNIGHRLLSKMGWSEGDRIGKTGGLEAPIVAIVKNTKSGLGA